MRPGATNLELGHLAALAAAFFGSIASIVVRKVGADERPLVLLIYPMMANFVLMAIALPFVYKPMPIEHLGLIGLVAMLAWIASRMMITAYQNGEAAIIAPMQYSQIIWATIYGFWFFGETIDTPTGVGASIIIASGLYIVLRESRSGASKTTPVLRTRSRGETATTPRVSFALRDNLEALKSTGTNLSRALGIGGGAQSPFWVELVATVLDMPIDLPEKGEFGAALGAAMQRNLAHYFTWLNGCRISCSPAPYSLALLLPRRPGAELR